LVQGWNQPWSGSVGTDWMEPDLFVDLCKAMERACFDYAMIEDGSFLPDAFQDASVVSGEFVSVLISSFDVEGEGRIGVKLGCHGRAGWYPVVAGESRPCTDFSQPAPQGVDGRPFADHDVEGYMPLF
jgi:hypothetical protein